MEMSKSKFRNIIRVIGTAILISGLPNTAQAASPALNASQAMIVHSFDGVGCQDISSEPREGHMRSGSCVEFQIKIENSHYSKAAKAITFKNPVDQNLIFVKVNKQGFVGGRLDSPKMNTDCGAQQCIITLSNASLRPKETGVLKIRAIVK